MKAIDGQATHLYKRSTEHRQERSVPASRPICHLISGCKATIARMFVNNASGQCGLFSQYEVVCSDEIFGVSLDQKDCGNIVKATWSLKSSASERRAFAQMAAW